MPQTEAIFSGVNSTIFSFSASKFSVYPAMYCSS